MGSNSWTTRTRGRTATRAAAVIATTCAIALAAACAPLPTPAEGYDPDLAPRANEAAYAEHGPYEVGVTTIQLSDRSAEVWYPVDPEDVGEGPRDAYFIKDYLSTAFAALVPAEVNPPYVTDATRAVPASDAGPFPLVLFSHGFASYRTQSTFLTTHLASWGFVVVSPDYLERGLRSVLGEPPATTRADLDVADEAIEAIRSATADDADPLGGVVDASTVYPVGHSAGGSTSIRLLTREDVTMAVPLAAGLNITSVPNAVNMLPADKAVTWIAAPNDAIASIDDVRRGFDYTAGERKIVEIAGSGHVNAFSDICEIGDGGVVDLAESIGIPIPAGLLALGDDGCSVPPFKDSLEVWPEVRHFVTAELRYRSGLDAEPVGLGSGVTASFDDIARYSKNP